jgi:hypothetical protein
MLPFRASIAPQPSEAVAVHIHALQELTLDIDAALRGRDLPASPRARIAFGCLDLAVEHTSGIAVLADQPLWGPAFAMLRIQFEAFIRGVWLARCAADDQLAWFTSGKLDKHRNFRELVADVERALKHDGGALSRLREQSWPMFNDFTHTGFQHVVRRNSETRTGPNYSDPELIQAMRFTSAIGLLAAVEMLTLAGHDVLARALKQKADAIKDKPKAPVHA